MNTSHPIYHPPDVIHATVQLTYTGLEAVFTLWTLSTVTKGGLDWSAQEIGQVSYYRCVTHVPQPSQIARNPQPFDKVDVQSSLWRHLNTAAHH